MKLFRRPVPHPNGELQYGYTTHEGDVTEFVVQLYCWIDGEWQLVAQSDHNPDMEQGHDVRTEGIHIDVFRKGTKDHVETDSHPGPIEPDVAFNYSINYLEQHDEQYIKRYRSWLDE